MTITTHPTCYAFRDLRPDDMTPIQELFAATHLDAMRGLPPDRHALGRRAIDNEIDTQLGDIARHYGTPPNRWFLLAAGDQTVAAFCALVQVDDRTAELKNVVVSPEHQGQGLGRQLMEAVEAHARAAGYGRIMLKTYAHLTVATGMYRRRGYVPRPPPEVPDQFEALGPLYLELDLAPPVRPAGA